METNAKAPYFPTLGGEVKCWECDRQGCTSRDRYQRNRRDFFVTSDRCPRLPGYHGLVDEENPQLYEANFRVKEAVDEW